MENKKILLIITGSIAAYKSMDLVRLLKKKGYLITCVLTKSAQEFITPLLVSSLSGTKTYANLFDCDDELEMGHINLSRENDLIIVAPATADFIAKMANGLADDLASNIILAANKKIMIAPAMNEKMLEQKSTQDNLQSLNEAGISIIEPEIDVLACGEYGKGKMSDVQKICDEVCSYFENQNRLKDKKILITGGSTIEKIDPVRFISNYSSGKQSIALAKILSEMGAKITFISGNIKEKIPLKKENIIEVKSADDMFLAVKNNLDQKDVFIACAAVSDYKVKNQSTQKIKKTNEDLSLELEKNPDILNFVGHAPNRPALVIGFAAESENLIENAKEKLKKKNCDLIVVNDVENGQIFGSNQTKVNFVDKKEVQNLGKISKIELAKKLAQKIANL